MKLLLFAATAAIGCAGPILYTIGADPSGVPNQLVRVDTNTASVVTVTTIGDGATSFAGGIQAFTATGFGGFATDSNGLAGIVQYDTSGIVSFSLALGTFQPGGIFIDFANILGYWVENDSNGNWKIATPSTLASGGGELASGLAVDTASSTLYLVLNDSQGNSRLLGLDAATGTETANVSLGVGFYGGVAFDPAVALFYLIASNSQGEATLYNYSLGGPPPTPLFSLGTQGFQFAALTVAVEDVPEPSAWLITLVGLGTLSAWVRTRRA
ncbi:MAG: hypothetical protein FJW32_15660 [Acidobacteria bacterium]|nr:hypothetical protein [Acidobacteriota bacterium]